MSDFKDEKKEVMPTPYNPSEMLNKPLTMEQLKLLDMKQYLVQSADLKIFEMLPLDNIQQADMLRSLCFVKEPEPESK